MTRSGKGEERPNQSSTRHISLEDFMFTRDHVLKGLTRVESSIQELTRAYTMHSNNIIRKVSGSSLELFNLGGPILDANTLFTGQFEPQRPIQLEGPPAGKRKKRAHDKNAPKRPVTPYFLYMQTERSKIAKELDPAHSAKDVADEGTKRWNVMPPGEREYWSYQYAINLARYREKVKAYKAGEPIPEISDAEAKKLFDNDKKNGLTTEGLLAQAELEPHEDNLESESSVSTSSEEPPESPKAPTPPRSSRRRKSDRDQPVKQRSPSPPIKRLDVDSDESESEVVEKKSKRPTRKRDYKEIDESLGSGDLVSAVIPPKRSSENSSKTKRSKRKRRSENFDD